MKFTGRFDTAAAASLQRIELLFQTTRWCDAFAVRPHARGNVGELRACIIAKLTAHRRVKLRRRSRCQSCKPVATRTFRVQPTIDTLRNHCVAKMGRQVDGRTDGSSSGRDYLAANVFDTRPKTVDRRLTAADCGQIKTKNGIVAHRRARVKRNALRLGRGGEEGRRRRHSICPSARSPGGSEPRF